MNYSREFLWTPTQSLLLSMFDTCSYKSAEIPTDILSAERVAKKKRAFYHSDFINSLSVENCQCECYHNTKSFYSSFLLFDFLLLLLLQCINHVYMIASFQQYVRERQLPMKCNFHQLNTFKRVLVEIDVDFHRVVDQHTTTWCACYIL